MEFISIVLKHAKIDAEVDNFWMKWMAIFVFWAKNDGFFHEKCFQWLFPVSCRLVLTRWLNFLGFKQLPILKIFWTLFGIIYIFWTKFRTLFLVSANNSAHLAEKTGKPKMGYFRNKAEKFFFYLKRSRILMNQNVEKVSELLSF